MDFWTTLGASAAGSAVDVALGQYSAGQGAAIDFDQHRRIDEYDYAQARARGITAAEYYGSGSPASSVPSGATQTLGSAATSGTQAALLGRQQDREVQMRAQDMQYKTATDVAQIQAGVNTRGQNIDKAIKEGRLELDRQTYYMNLRTATQNIRQSEQQVQKLINDTATSDPRFVTAMKQLSMGPSNLLTELTMRHHGIKLSDESFKNMSKDKRKAILAQLLALSSRSYVEAAGAQSLGKDVAEGSNSTLDHIINILSGTGKGIEATGAPPNKTTLGREQTNAESIENRDARRTNPYN